MRIKILLAFFVNFSLAYFMIRISECLETSAE